MAKIKVKDTEIRIIQINDNDYISLTDMLRAKDGEYFFYNWLRNRNTIEFLGIWEKVYNPNFNSVEFDRIKSQAGLNSFRLSAKEWTESTHAIGIVSKTGRYGGTYAHKDIAMEFAMWISPEFKVYLIREFQRLKEDEQKLLGWSANEADVLNMALFGITAAQWRETNPNKKGNIRDYATINQLICLSNMENLNAVFIEQGIPQKERLIKLNQIAIQQMKILEANNERTFLK